MAWNAVIETSSGDLLRHGFGPVTAGAGETELLDAPRPRAPKIANGDVDRDDFHRWNGSSFDLIGRSLVSLKRTKITRLTGGLDGFLERSYSVAQQLGFLFLANEGQTGGLTARLTFIQQLGDWFKAAGTELATQRTAVNAAATPAAVRAIELDLATLRTADPKITVRAAQQITT